MNAPPVTLEGMRRGVWMVVPVVPGVVVFAAAFGTAAAQKGMSLLEAVLTSMLVFAGASQLVALEIWTDHWTGAGLLAVALVTFTVNARLILMGASLQPWIGSLPGPVLWPSMALLTDANWLACERYRAGGGEDAGVMIGSGLFLWMVWVVATVPGQLLGGLIRDPRAFGIDLVVPIFFVAMGVSLWKSGRDTAVWMVAGAVSLLTWWLWPGYGFIVTGALAGAATGAILPDPRHD